MEKNKTGKYFKYAIGEIVLVVIGILIALQLNLYKENYQTNSIRKDYYKQLIGGLNNDKVHLEENILIIDSFKTEYNRYLETFKKKDLSVEIMIQNILKVNLNANLISFNSSTFQSLEKSGDIKILSKVIRNKLLDLKSKQDLLVERVNNNSLIQTEFLKEYFLAIGSNSLSERISSHPKIKEFLNTEINQPKGFLSLESNISWKLITEKSSDFKEQVSEIEELIELINIELKK
ncbi:hypothetical protein [Maribacter antarcticus]|uniref:hypothetical protein n=1 Tax=Maribacter antarcticus TaxID=505250 RepID=UPI00047DD0A0|nr:hypothetical protein [Maribacter antarcticus]